MSRTLDRVMDKDDRFKYYLQYYTEQRGDGMSYYQGRDYVPMPQEGDGLGDLFASAKPMFMGFAKKAGKNLLSAGTSVLRDVLSGKDAKASARQAFSNAGLNLLDEIVDGGSSSSSSSQPKRQRKGRVSKKNTKNKGKSNIFR